MSSLFQTYGRWNIEIKKAKGTCVEDQNGKTYLDFIQGIAVSNLGHCHEAVTEAVKKQLDSVWHVSNLFENSLQEQAAQQLAANSAGDLVFSATAERKRMKARLSWHERQLEKRKSSHFFNHSTAAPMQGWQLPDRIKSKQASARCWKAFTTSRTMILPLLTLLGEDDIAAVMLETVQEKAESIRPVQNF